MCRLFTPHPLRPQVCATAQRGSSQRFLNTFALVAAYMHWLNGLNWVCPQATMPMTQPSQQAKPQRLLVRS